MPYGHAGRGRVYSLRAHRGVHAHTWTLQAAQQYLSTARDNALQLKPLAINHTTAAMCTKNSAQLNGCGRDVSGKRSTI